MLENPYQSPAVVKISARPSPGWAGWMLGCLGLAPLCWLAGRALIPPDNLALACSGAVWLILTVVWAGLVLQNGRRTILWGAESTSALLGRELLHQNPRSTQDPRPCIEVH